MPSSGPRVERVLVLEDDRDTLESLVDLLGMEGVSMVRGARTCSEADHILNDGFVPSVVVLDLRLERDHGEAFARRLRADPVYGKVPLIALSGDHAALRRIQGVVSRSFLKPASPEALLRALRELCKP